MTLFWPVFDHLLDRLICVCLILRPNYGHIWVKHEKMVQKGVKKWEHGLTTRIFRQNWVIFHLFLRLGPSDHLELQEVVKKGPKIDPFFGSFFTFFCVFSRHPSYWRLKYEGHKISGEKGVQKVAKNGQKWPIFGSFLGHFCHVLPSKLGNLGTPKSGQKWPKMAYFWSFLTTFWTDLFVCVLF